MNIRIVLIALFTFLAQWTSAQEENDLFNEQNSLKYANYLFDLNQFQSALTEFERLLAFDSASLYYQKRYLQSAIGLGRYEQVEIFTNELYEEPKLLPKELILLNLRAIHLQENPKQFNAQLYRFEQLTDQEVYFWKSFSAIYWQKPQLVSGLQEFSSAPLFSELALMHQEALTIKRKHPFVAASMSTVLPGSGKLYTGEWQDAIMSLIFVGVSAFQSYRGFNDKGVESVYGWLFGTIGLGYYFGNIYGSVKSAKKYNDKKYSHLRNRMDLLVW